jgi:branched-chain amino acid transport system substrate-binding protein
MNNLKAAASLVAMLVLGSALAGCGANSLSASSGSEASADAIKLGLMAPSSGVYASIGKDLTRGMRLYLDQHDGRLGGRKVDLVTVDEGGGPDTGTPAARRLIQQDKVVAATGVVNSATGAAVAPMFDAAHIPVVSSAQLAYGTTLPYWWVDSYPNAATSTSMADYLGKTLTKGDGVYLISSDYSQGHAIMGSMAKLLAARGIRVLGTTYTPLSSTLDFQPYLSDIKKAGAHAVYAYYAGADAVRFVKQYSQSGLGGQATLYANLALTEGNLAAQGDTAVGVVTNSIYTAQLDTPENTAFVRDYGKAYGGDEPSVYSEMQYAAASVLDKALGTLKGKSVTGTQIRDAIASLGEITTPRGSWRFDENHMPTQMIYLRKAQANGATVTNPVIARLGVYSSAGKKVG